VAKACVGRVSSLSIKATYFKNESMNEIIMRMEDNRKTDKK
jgi:hypothetical protein